MTSIISIMEKNYFYILSVNYIISTQCLVSSSPSSLPTLSFSYNYRRSTTYWVFWYYGDSGDRQCGNYCIIVFSIVAFLLLCIILCGCLKCYFIRQRYKEDEKYTGDSSIENALAAVWPDQAPYGDETVGDEPNFFHNLRRRSPFQAVRYANKFSKDHPPFEALPPPEHMNYLKDTGINAWKFSDDNLIRANIITHLLSSDNQHQDLSLAPPPYELPSTSALGKPGKWFYYYEVTIRSNPNKKDTTIAIVGYHSNNGNKFHNESFAGREYGEKWGDEGDTIGCGYYPNTGYVFFTKNGKFQEIAFTGLFHIWFPTIGTDGECTMEINFGDNNGKEFVYQEAIGMSVCGPINNEIISNENELHISKVEKNNYNL
ncbi:1718_t:CDS:2 [Entrophospora sp. SA101]|nr:1718_t:CDS:2 [Entrophospora sp. SA101]